MPAPLAQRSRGQASVEAVCLALAVAALLAALALSGWGLPAAVVAAVAHVLGADEATPTAAPATFAGAPPAVQRFVLQAVAGADDGSAPTLLDAERRLGEIIGADAAHREVMALAWSHLLAVAPEVTPGGTFPAVNPEPLGRFEGSRLAGIGPLPAEDRTMFWSTERLRAGPTSHLVSAEEERRIVASLKPAASGRLEAIAYVGGTLVLSALDPLFAAGVVAFEAAQAGLSRERGPAVPAGARDGDAVFCLEVERTNHVGADGQRFDETVRVLRPDEPLRFTRVAIVRDGRLVAEGLTNQEQCDA